MLKRFDDLKFLFVFLIYRELWVFEISVECNDFARVQFDYKRMVVSRAIAVGLYGSGQSNWKLASEWRSFENRLSLGSPAAAIDCVMHENQSFPVSLGKTQVFYDSLLKI